MSRPSILYQRLVVPASTVAAGLPGIQVPTDPTFLAAPEATEVDYVFIDEEHGLDRDYVVQPFLHEREFWTPEAVLPTTLHNLNGRVSDSNDYGEWKLPVPFLAVKGHGIGIEIENRIPDFGTALKVHFIGEGRDSKREYTLSFDCNLPAGAVGAPARVAFGGRNTYVSGKEDVWIHTVAWARKPGNPDFPGLPFAFNPRLIGMLVRPSFGTRWSGPGGGGTGGAFVPLIVMSNIRGPRAACFYKPNRQLILEQGDTFNLQVSPYTPNNGSTVLIAVVGKTVAA